LNSERDLGRIQKSRACLKSTANYWVPVSPTRPPVLDLNFEKTDHQDTELHELKLGSFENPDVVGTGIVMTVGPNDPIRIDDYAAMIADKIGWSGTIHWDSKPRRPGEIYWLNSNNNLIHQLLGWQPTVDLSQGLDRTIEIWRDNLKLQ
jgi:hypothetical protein